MKKLLSLAMLLTLAIVLIGCATTTTTPEVCDVDINGVCVYNNGDIEWEADEIVTIGVDTQVLADALEAAWDAAYPALAGKVNGVLYEASDSESSGVTGVVTLQGEAPDIVLIIGSGSVGREVNFLDLDNYMDDVINNDVLQSALNSINSGDKVQYLPGVYDGMAFSWNKTMLEYLIADGQLSITLADANSDNLPDAFDTWEEIFAIADSLNVASAADLMTFEYTKDGDTTPTVQTIYEWYPLCLGQEWANYSAYTAGGWQLFPEEDYTDPGFDTNEFLAGLEFIKTFSEHDMSFQENGTKLTSAGMGWRWDNYLKNEYPFALVGTWMDVATNENTYNSDFVFSALPTFGGRTMTPIVKTKGFAVNAYTSCPGAAVTVLKWLYTQDGMTAISENSSYLLALESDSDLFPASLTENQLQFAQALGTGHNEPAALLPLSSSVLAVNVLYNSGITAAQQAIWDGSMTTAAAQAAIVAAAATWVTTNNVAD